MPPSLFNRLFTYLFVERPARQQSLAQLVAQLQQSTHELALRLTTVPNTAENYHQMAHILTLERWGQSRLRVALGQPFVADESDAYAPSAERVFVELINDFLAAREQTLEIAQAIQQANPPADLKILHDQFGPLSVKGWLRYLTEHADLESERLHTSVSR